VYALRFRAYGRRRYLTLGTAHEGWTEGRARDELENVLADVRRGIWREPEPEPVVEEPRREPSFHEFASEWLAGRRHELSEQTVKNYRWALSVHLLPFFHRQRLGAVTVEEVDRYRSTKVREGNLAPRSINKTIALLAQVLESAVEYGYLNRNPASGKRRRLKTDAPRRHFLDADQVRALLDAAGSHRTLLATAIMAGGLRISEVAGLRWRDVDLARGRLRVAASKTEAGVREVDLSPHLGEELSAHKATSGFSRPGDYVFPTEKGTRRERNNIRARILRPVIARANRALEEQGLAPISEGVTFHSLRHTYASLMAEAGVDPAYTKAQIGHTNASFTMTVYTHVGNRREAANARLDALLGGADRAVMGSSPASSVRESSFESEAKRDEPAHSAESTKSRQGDP